MNNQPFTIERTIDAPVEKVWKAITNKDDMKKWYFDLKEFKPEAGFKFQFVGEGKDRDKEYVHICEVTEVVPQKKLTYSWRYEGYEGNSFVTFELSPDGNKTILKLTHAGLETFPATIPDFARENFVEGWTSIIGESLTNFFSK
ncbi:MAG: SRPBCC domain-containing protein [Fimbriimonadaceae bacterium]|nr:SRPBCC domain-containing protein [Chitinophagales bacterium]